MIFHVDANSFYASCERLFRPDLDGKPIAVLSNNDGITIALNQECKDLGFHRGDVFFKCRDKYCLNGVNVFSSNYTLYADISSRLNRLYADFCPDIEVYSIDESFLFFPDWVNAGFTQMGHELRVMAARNVHIPVSVGIAPTKTLAKMCNKLAKHRGGVCNWQECDGDAELAAYPVEDVWGIGWSKAIKLKSRGVRTALDLKNYPLNRAKADLTITGFRTVQELNGIPAIDAIEERDKDNITTSKSFAHGVTSLAELQTALAEYIQLAVEKMRKQKSVCRIVSIFIGTARAFEERDKSKEYFNGISARLYEPTDFLPELQDMAKRLLDIIYEPGFAYRKVAVNLFDLMPAINVQPQLFQTERVNERENQKALMDALDKINFRYGRGCLHMGLRNQVSDTQKDGTLPAWIMEQKYLSPKYTTNFTDLPSVK